MIALCEGYFRQLDGIIARDRRARRPGADRRARVRPRLRADLGRASTSTPGSSSRATWPGATSDARGATDAPQVGFGQMTRHVFELDWERTRRLRRDAEQPGHPHRPHGARGPTRDVRRASTSSSPRRSRRGCCELRHPETGRPLVARRAAARGHVRRARTRSSRPTSRSCSKTAPPCRSCARTRSCGRGASRSGNHRPDGIFSRAARRSGRGEHARRALDRRRRAAAPVQPRRAGAARHVRPRPRARSFEPGELERRPPRSSPAAAPAASRRAGRRRRRLRQRRRGDDPQPPARARIRGVSEERRCRRSTLESGAAGSTTSRSAKGPTW